MFPEALPPCPCGGRHNYRSGGAYFGPGLSSQWFTCEVCFRPTLLVTHGMVVLVTPTEPLADLPEEGLAWVNGALRVTMAAYVSACDEARRAAEKAAWDLHCDLHGLPRGTKFAHVAGERCLQRPDGSAIEDPLAVERADVMYRLLDRRRWHLSPPTPPLVPDCLHVRVLDNEWVEVDREHSASLRVPPDPRRVAHDARFAALFAGLRAMGHEFSPREVENQYCGSAAEPWYAFEYRGREYAVGPRKRVVSITVRSAELFPVATLKKFADRDGVTFNVDGEMQVTVADLAREVTIHAWTGEKVVEYLAAMMAR